MAAAAAAAAVLVVPGRAASTPPDGTDTRPADSTWTTILVPDPGTLYVRYGPPRGLGLTDSAGARRSGAAGDDRSLLGRHIRHLVREELQRLQADELGTGRDDPHGWPGLGAHSGPRPHEGARRDDARGSSWQTVVVQPSAPPAREAGSRSSGAGGAPDTRGGAAAPEALPAPEAQAEHEQVLHDQVLHEQVLHEQVLHEQVLRHLLDEGLLTTQMVLFDTDRSALMPGATGVLDAVGRVMREYPRLHLRVEGYADRRGPAAHNLRLSERRAEAVRRYVLETFSLPPQRLSAIGFGEEDPVAAGSTPTALALNRRVVFRVVDR